MRKSVLGLLGILAIPSISAEEADAITNESATEARQSIESGFSLGLGLGAEWGQIKGRISMKSTAGDNDRGEKNKMNSDRVFGVFSLGYNQVIDRFLIGLGGAYSFGEKQTKHVLFYNEDSNTSNDEADLNLQPLRGVAETFGKFGFFCCPKSLIYMKLSAVWQRTKYVGTLSGNNYLWEGTQTKIAPKISLGYERAIASNFSVFAEYGYTFNTKKTYERINKPAAITYTAHDELKREKGHSLVFGVACNIGLN